MGPGDPDLITVKAQKVLSEVDVVFVPKSKLEAESIALQIAQKFIPKGIPVVDILLPMTSNKEELLKHWHQGCQRIKDQLQGGKSGAFITLGDSMLYSTYSYLLGILKKEEINMTIETIPGITAFSASAAATKWPLAEGSEKLAVIPVLKDVSELESVLNLFDNVVLMKVAPSFKNIINVLQKRNLLQQAILISKCGHPDQEIIEDLENAREEIPYLSLMIIKKGD